MTELNQISYQIEQQFPALYRREGENLIKFVEAYYEWMEQSGFPVNEALLLPQYLDIDTTLNEFLSHFKETYMVGLPSSVIGNQRLLQKHILDLYRSKNSKTSLELLFRLMFNKSIEVYIPSSDVLRTSDGKFQRRRYIEVDYTPDLKNFIGKSIFGSVSGATAIVVNVETRTINNVPRYIVFVEDVRGIFQISENLYYSATFDHNPARVIGSIVEIDVDVSVSGWSVGEEVFIDQNVTPSKGEGIRAFISEVYDSTSGQIFPSVVNGGTGYSMNATVTVEDFQNTFGEDATFVVGSLVNTSVIDVTDLTVNTLMGIQIDAADYDLDDDNDTIEDHTSEIGSVMQYFDLTVGSIGSLRTLDPGHDYDGKVNITVVEPRTARLGWFELDGSQTGNNAVIDNFAAFGSSLAKTIAIHDSGFGYTGQLDNYVTVADADNNKVASGRFVFGAVGQNQGRFLNNDGMLSSTKRLQDSFYYQEYSYEIRVSESLARYAEVVKAVVHPSGNELFGSIKVVDDAQIAVSLDSEVTIS
ncbi:structural protein [Rhizobium phage RHph_I1_18]|nr:structural protein [Rhizobium phage RHph_I1_18]